MRALRAWLLRLGASVTGRAKPGDVADELSSHLALHIDDNLRAGMTPDEARRAAMLKLGGLAQTAESIHEQRGLPFFDTLRQDLVYAVRVLRRNRAFTATAVVTFALGVGATSAIFSIVNAILLRPLPLAEPSQLVMIFATEARRSLQFDGVSYPAFIDWQAQNRSFESMAAFANRDLPIGTSDEVVVARGKVVSANLFDVVGVQPAIGRAFRDWRPQSADVVILNDGFWKRHFGGSPSAIGQTVRIDERPHTIVGVMPPGFSLDGDSEEFFQPLGVDTNRNRGFLRTVGRLRSGVTVEHARDDMSAIARRLEQLYPDSHAGVESAQPVAESLRGARDRLHSPRVSGPRDHPQRPASPPPASRVSRLLPSEPHASRPAQRRPGRQAGVCRVRPDHRVAGGRRLASPLRSSGRVSGRRDACRDAGARRELCLLRRSACEIRSGARRECPLPIDSSRGQWRQQRADSVLANHRHKKGHNELPSIWAVSVSD